MLTENFDYKLDYKIWKSFNSVQTKIRNVTLNNHQLIGKQFVDSLDNRTYTIKTINKQWYRGWALLAVAVAVAVADDVTGSSRAVLVENLSCHNEDYLKQIKEFKETCTFIN